MPIHVFNQAIVSIQQHLLCMLYIIQDYVRNQFVCYPHVYSPLSSCLTPGDPCVWMYMLAPRGAVWALARNPLNIKYVGHSANFHYQNTAQIDTQMAIACVFVFHVM